MHTMIFKSSHACRPVNGVLRREAPLNFIEVVSGNVYTTTVPRSRAALSYIEDVVIEVKCRYKDPFIVVAGNFNHWPIDRALADITDIREANFGPTRKDRCIDEIFSHFSRAINASGTVPPLEVEPGISGTKSDHRIAYIEAGLPRIKNYT